MYKKTVIYNDNGEIVNDKTLRYKNKFDEEEGYLFWNQRNFVKTFSDVEYPKEMNDIEIGRMARLSKKVWSNTNMLGYRGNGGIRPYDINCIGQIIGIQQRQAERFISKMIKLGIMAKVSIKVEGKTEVQYYLNPIYFFSSNRIPLNLYLIFRKQLDEVLPKWVKESYDTQVHEDSKHEAKLK